MQLTSAVSGGIGSVIGGGDFLQGAAQGLVVYFANHLAHELTPEQRRAKLKASIEKDGILTLKEANKWYRRGDGSPITVDASKLDLSRVDADWLVYGKAVEINLEFTGPAAVGNVYGKLSLTLGNSATVKIADNTYDFDLPAKNWTNSFKSFLRNVGTVGGYLNSLTYNQEYISYGVPLPHGKPFNIQFKGVGNVKNFNLCNSKCN